MLRDPSRFLDAAAEAAPGWGVQYGGPERVAQLTSVLHDHLAQLTKLNAELRTSTPIYLRTQLNMSLAKLADLLGVTRTAVHVASRRTDDDAQLAPGPFSQLESPGAWDT